MMAKENKGLTSVQLQFQSLEQNQSMSVGEPRVQCAYQTKKKIIRSQTKNYNVDIQRHYMKNQECLTAPDLLVEPYHKDGSSVGLCSKDNSLLRSARRNLQERFQREKSHMFISHLDQSKQFLDMSNYYVPPIFQERDADNSVREVGLTDLFVHSERRILIIGNSGYGKTALCTKLAFDWTRLKPPHYLSRFLLLFVVPLKKINHHSSALREIILNEIVRNCKSKNLARTKRKVVEKEIISMLKKFQESILVILDGYEDDFNDFYDDYFSYEYQSEQLRIILHEIFPKATILVTAPPLSAINIASLFKRHLFLKRFSTKQKAQLIHSYFGKEKSKGQLLDYLEESDVVSRLTGCPLVLQLICLCYENSDEYADELKNIKTVSDVYNAVMSLTYDDTKILNNDLFCLGETILQSYRLGMTFSHIRIQGNIPWDLQKLGVLRTAKNMKLSEDYTPHDSFKDYFVAVYLSSTVSQSSSSTTRIRQFIDRYRLSDFYINVIMFLHGIDGGHRHTTMPGNDPCIVCSEKETAFKHFTNYYHTNDNYASDIIWYLFEVLNQSGDTFDFKNHNIKTNRTVLNWDSYFNPQKIDRQQLVSHPEDRTHGVYLKKISRHTPLYPVERQCATTSSGFCKSMRPEDPLLVSKFLTTSVAHRPKNDALGPSATLLALPKKRLQTKGSFHPKTLEATTTTFEEEVADESRTIFRSEDLLEHLQNATRILLTEASTHMPVYLGEKRFPINDYYIDPSLCVNSLPNRHSTDKPGIQIDELFSSESQDRLPPKRILLTGESGVGKTTLCHKLIANWACKEEYLSQFKLLFFLPSNDYRGGSIEENVLNIVLKITDGMNFTTEDILFLFDELQDKVLLILDGYDEKHFSSVSDLLTFQDNNCELSLCEASILFTSRPQFSKKLKRFFHKDVTLKGFSSEQQLRYVHKFFRDRQLSDSLAQFVVKHNSLTTLCENPLFLQHLCVHHETGKMISCPPGNNPTLLSHLYELFLHAVLQKCLAERVDVWSVLELFQFCDDCLQTVGRHFLELSDSETYINSPSEFPSEKESLKYDMLVKVNLMKKTVSSPGKIKFEISDTVHTRILEFCVALYLSTQTFSESVIVQLEEKKSMDATWQILNFADGINKGRCSRILNGQKRKAEFRNLTRQLSSVRQSKQDFSIINESNFSISLRDNEFNSETARQAIECQSPKGAESNDHREANSSQMSRSEAYKFEFEKSWRLI